MADDGRANRPKKSSRDDVAVVAENDELRRRNAELESEIEKLRQEIAQLRQRCRQQEGNHDVLPVAVATVATVDLSQVDSSIVTHISSFLGTSGELLDLALTCKSFGWHHPASTQNISLVEWVARQAVSSRASDAEMGCLPRYIRG
ncbi:hypothetical protein THAOC_17799, partial [Thalassiosira oceanica]